MPGESPEPGWGDMSGASLKIYNAETGAFESQAEPALRPAILGGRRPITPMNHHLMASQATDVALVHPEPESPTLRGESSASMERQGSLRDLFASKARAAKHEENGSTGGVQSGGNTPNHDSVRSARASWGGGDNTPKGNGSPYGEAHKSVMSSFERSGSGSIRGGSILARALAGSGNNSMENMSAPGAGAVNPPAGSTGGGSNSSTPGAKAPDGDRATSAFRVPAYAAMISGASSLFVPKSKKNSGIDAYIKSTLGRARKSGILRGQDHGGSKVLRRKARKRVRFDLRLRKGIKPPSAFSVFLSLFHPGRFVLRFWVEFRVVLFSYELWALPYRLALGGTEPLKSNLFWVDLFFDFLFTLDLVMSVFAHVHHDQMELAAQRALSIESGTGDAADADSMPFGLAIHQPQGARKSKSKSERERHKLAEMATNLNISRRMGASLTSYVRGRMIFDVLAIIMMYVSLALGMSYMWYWLFTVPRLVRPVRLYWYFRTKEMQLHVDVRRVAFYKFLVLIFGIAHWVGSLSYWIARLSDFSNEERNSSWVGQFKEIAGIDYDEATSSTMKSYLLILYKGFNGLTNLGYEVVAPQRPEEMAFSIVVIFVQVVLQAYILGTLFHYIVKKDANLDAFRRQMQNLMDYCRTRRLPPGLQERLRKHFEFQHMKKKQDDSKVLRQLPNTLRMKIASYEHADVIRRNNHIFRGCNLQFLSALTTRLREVYLMPSEVMMSQNDMPRELCFVTSGVLDQRKDDVLIKSVRSDSEAPSVAGEVAFFMGMPQPYNIQARATSDVTLLVFSKFDYEDMIQSYPEQHDIIVTNLLQQYELDKNGNDIQTRTYYSTGISSGGVLGGGGMEEDEELLALKVTIQNQLKKRNADALSAMTYAASEGDVETVRNLLQRGLPVNTGDYDMRTTLHLAAVEGNLRVVEVLLAEGADVNVKDRWGHTPLQEAISNKHGPVIDLLRHNHAILGYTDPSSHLCSAASEGSITKLQMLLDNGIDPDVGDYDQRTAFHLAASEGNGQVIEYLLSRQANVNVVDRWGRSPLEDAVKSRNHLVAQMIRLYGGTFSVDFAAGALCSAASEGDLDMLKLLLDNGVDVNIGDYDFRTALHLCCAEGQLLSVYFLLYMCTADVNAKDRWGRTPLQDAVDHGHASVVRLVHAVGGELGTPIGDEDPKAKFDEILSAAPPIYQVREEVAVLLKKVNKGQINPGMLDVEQAARFNHLLVVETINSFGSLREAAESAATAVKAVENAVNPLMMYLEELLRPPVIDRRDARVHSMVKAATIDGILPTRLKDYGSLKGMTRSGSMEKGPGGEDVLGAAIAPVHPNSSSDVEAAGGGGIHTLPGATAADSSAESAPKERTADWQTALRRADSILSLASAGGGAGTSMRGRRNSVDPRPSIDSAGTGGGGVAGLVRRMSLQSSSFISNGSAAVHPDVSAEDLGPTARSSSTSDMRNPNDPKPTPESGGSLRAFRARALDADRINDSLENIRSRGSAAVGGGGTMPRVGSRTDLSESALPTLEEIDDDAGHASFPGAASAGLGDNPLARPSGSFESLSLRKMPSTRPRAESEESQQQLALGKAMEFDSSELGNLKPATPGSSVGTVTLPFSRGPAAAAAAGGGGGGGGGAGGGVSGALPDMSLASFDPLMDRPLAAMDLEERVGLRNRHFNRIILQFWVVESVMCMFQDLFNRVHKQVINPSDVIKEIMQQIGGDVTDLDPHDLDDMVVEATVCEDFGADDDEVPFTFVGLASSIRFFAMVCNTAIGGKGGPLSPEDVSHALKDPHGYKDISWHGGTINKVNVQVLQHALSVIHSAFALFDVDGNGVIALDELNEVQDYLGEMSSDLMEDIFSRYDVADSGILTRRQFVTCFLTWVGVLEDDDDSDVDSFMDDDEHEGGGAKAAASAFGGGTLGSLLLGHLRGGGDASGSGKGVVGGASAPADDGKERLGAHQLWGRARKEVVETQGLLQRIGFISKKVPKDPRKAAVVKLIKHLQYTYPAGLVHISDVADIMRHLNGGVHVPPQEAGHLMALVDNASIGGGLQRDGMIGLNDLQRAFEAYFAAGRSLSGEKEVQVDADTFNARNSRDQHHHGFALPTGANPLIIPPNAAWLPHWDMFIRVLAVYFFFECPFRIAFVSLQEEDMGPWYDYFNLAIDCLLFADMGTKFLRAYVNSKSVLVYDMRRIAKRYLGRTFLLDAVAAFPFDLLAQSAGGSRGYSAWLRLTKMLRLYRVMVWYKLQEKDLNADSLRAGIKRLTPLIIGVSHIAACVWWYLGAQNLMAAEEDPEAYLDNVPRNWPRHYVAFGVELIDKETSTVWQYLLSYYWVSASLSTNGLVGNATPKNFNEVLFTIGMMLLSMTLYAYALGEISNLVIKEDEELVATRSQVQTVEKFIQAHNLPPNLARDITQHFDIITSKAAAGGDGDGSFDIFNMLSHSLQVEVARNISRGLISGVTLFTGCNANFLDSLSVLLREVTISPDNLIYRVNEVSRELYIVAQGMVELTNESEEDGEIIVSTKHASDVFGELPFFFGLRQATSARTPNSGHATLFTLQREDYKQLVKVYPHEEETLTKNSLQAWDTMRTNRSSLSSRSRDGSGSVGGGLNSARTDGTAKTGDTDALDDLVTVEKIAKAARKRKMEDKIVGIVKLASAGDLEQLQMHLKDVDVNDGDYDNRTVLHLAAAEGHLKIVKFLVDAMGADVSVKDRYDGAPIQDAIRHRHKEVAAYLREKGATLELSDAAGRLCAAAASADMDELMILVDSGIEINLADYDGRTALHLAASNGHREVVKYIIDIPGSNLSPEDRNGGTPLQDAIRHEHREVQKLLRKNGATLGEMEVAIRLCEAAASNDVETIRVLYENGADVNKGDYDQRTALHLAASNGNLDALAYPLQVVGKEGGIDVNPLDRFGCTPLDDAIRHERKVAECLLLEHGAVRGSDETLADKKKDQASLMTREEARRTRNKAISMIKDRDEAKATTALNQLARKVTLDRREMEHHIGVVESTLRDLIREALDSGTVLVQKEAMLEKGDLHLREKLKAIKKRIASEKPEIKKSKAIHILYPDLQRRFDGLDELHAKLEQTLRDTLRKAQEEAYYFESQLPVKLRMKRRKEMREEKKKAEQAAREYMSGQMGDTDGPENGPDGPVVKKQGWLGSLTRSTSRNSRNSHEAESDYRAQAQKEQQFAQRFFVKEPKTKSQTKGGENTKGHLKRSRSMGASHTQSTIARMGSGSLAKLANDELAKKGTGASGKGARKAADDMQVWPLGASTSAAAPEKPAVPFQRPTVPRLLRTQSYLDRVYS